MPRKSKLLTPEQIKIAEGNNIPMVTVYKRLKSGWKVKRAITQPTRNIDHMIRKDGLFVESEKGKRRSFNLDKDWDQDLEYIIQNSELEEDKLIEKIIVDRLKDLRKTGTNKIK